MHKTGIALLSTLIFMAVFTALLLYWYQNEILYRLQAEASLKYQSVYQALDGVVSETASLLKNYSEEQLRQNEINLLDTEGASFFSDWSVRSFPAKDSDFLKVQLSYLDLQNFRALFRFQSYSLTHFPWINLSQEAFELPTNLIFNSDQDYQLALTVPRISLIPFPINENFETVIYGDAQIEWQPDQITIRQGSKKITLNSGSNVQIKGDVTILGDLSHAYGKQWYFDIEGNLDLILPNKSKEFPSEETTLIIHVTEQLRLFAEGRPSEQTNNSSLQINGFIWVENNCFSTDSYIQEIYWKGGIACQLDASANISIPIHLLHSSFSDPPSAFNRTSLIWNGIRPLEL